ncbi:hypothetical protein [Corynebacterium variabile]
MDGLPLGCRPGGVRPELFAKLEAAASVSNYAAFQVAVGSWRGTAENRAAGIVPADDEALEWIAEPEPVDRPE